MSILIFSPFANFGNQSILWFNVCNKELLALRNNFRVTKKFLIAKLDCTLVSSLYKVNKILGDDDEKKNYSIRAPQKVACM